MPALVLNRYRNSIGYIYGIYQIGFDGQLQHRQVIQAHLIIFDFAGRACRAETPLLADDLFRRSTVR